MRQKPRRVELRSAAAIAKGADQGDRDEERWESTQGWAEGVCVEEGRLVSRSELVSSSTGRIGIARIANLTTDAFIELDLGCRLEEMPPVYRLGSRKSSGSRIRRLQLQQRLPRQTLRRPALRWRWMSPSRITLT
jgi:hypothetical protein